MIRKAIAALLVLTTGACVSTPEMLCDHEEQGLVALPTAPPEAPGLLAELRAKRPSAIDEGRDHIVWLRSTEGDLFLCTYRKHPVRTGTCGAIVHRFDRTPDGYVGGMITVSACH